MNGKYRHSGMRIYWRAGPRQRRLPNRPPRGPARVFLEAATCKPTEPPHPPSTTFGYVVWDQSSASAGAVSAVDSASSASVCPNYQQTKAPPPETGTNTGKGLAAIMLPTSPGGAPKASFLTWLYSSTGTTSLGLVNFLNITDLGMEHDPRQSCSFPSSLSSTLYTLMTTCELVNNGSCLSKYGISSITIQDMTAGGSSVLPVANATSSVVYLSSLIIIHSLQP